MLYVIEGTSKRTGKVEYLGVKKEYNISTNSYYSRCFEWYGNVSNDNVIQYENIDDAKDDVYDWEKSAKGKDYSFKIKQLDIIYQLKDV